MWIFLIAVASAAAFFISKKIYYTAGFKEGAIFADTSGYKQGYSIGFEEGYKFRDSIAKIEFALRASEQFNLNLIYDELGNPLAYIEISGGFTERKESALVRRYLIIKATNRAQFARYKDIEITVMFLDKRETPLKESTYEIKDILYPGRSISIEVPPKDIPEFSERVRFKLKGAQGID
ncbi:MAG: hypothetical protein KatS3mg031_0224 [Chitinophagales bacterium]|nr:MAG: hypothetical protein KatS3mg031_0224 [Chitinophagales bacterium]